MLLKIPCFRIIQHFAPTEPYRDSFLYNNLMFGLLSYVTEVVASGGATPAENSTLWEELITQKIFSPLQMSDSTFTSEIDYNFEADDVMATPYLLDDNGEFRSMSYDIHK